MPQSLQRLFAALSLLVFVSFWVGRGDAAWAADFFDCGVGDCGLASSKPYPHLVVGKLVAIADNATTQAIFTNRKAAGWWKALSDDKAKFVEKIQPVAIAYSEGRVMTLLMPAEEFNAAHLRVGDFVRFSPHRNFPWIKQEPNNPYWVAVGCVMVLCREDAACAPKYRSGIYRLSDGAEMDSNGKQPIPNGITIDDQTMLPHTESKRFFLFSLLFALL